MNSLVLRPTVVSAFVRRDFVGARSYRLAFLLDVFYVFLTLILYYFISRTFADFSPGALAGAPTYFAFAAVGLILGAVLDASSSGVAHRLREEQTSGTLEALNTEPVTPLEMCVGLVGFPFSFAVARAAVYMAFAAAFLGLDVSETSWPGLLLVLIASGAALAPIGMLAGAAVLVFKRGTLVSTTLVYLLTILSGMVFPVSSLPDWLEPVADVIPLTYAFDGARAAFFTGSNWEDEVLFLAAWGAGLWPLGLFAFASALAFAKRTGSLAQY